MKRAGAIFAAASFALASLIAPIASIAADKGPMVNGQVTEVRPNNELTIKHGPLPNLDMPAMTMVFKVAEPKMMKGVKRGDKIKFRADDKNGKLTVIHMEKAN